MSAPNPLDPGRNLLFGLLAFQTNFIDRRALLAAFDDWTNDKSRPLGQVLIDQGTITEDLHALIDGLVAAHLARHGDEPAQSLAALTPIGSVRKDLEALADPETRASLFQVSAARADFDPYATKAPSEADQASSDGPAGSDPFATKAPSVGTATSSGVRFQVLRPLNQGGMGVVSVALDKELDRSIALKEIRETAADDREYRARFLAEAEITGKLEHPGIIPIYGLGTYGDGRPFYAMRLIRGDKTGSLMDAIARFHKEPNRSDRVVEFRGLLGRFLDVCNAISYAHSKGVLHRDLKPDNILLGPYGETLVVDWGLAKAAGRAETVLHSDSEHVRLNLSGSELSPTLAGGAFGTPEYAPPEQMTGDLPNVGPRSDVYGLGAVLYCLMTGQAPFSRKGIDLGKLIQKIEAGEFPPPRQIRADLSKSLEAICLKAMNRKPAERYESVQKLASDVERYLADEPIAAYREPWTLRVRRWAKRHRTGVTAAAVALVVSSVGLGAITAIQTKARNELAIKNTELVDANRSLAEQRHRAEDREDQAIAAVRRFGDAITNEPELKNNPALDPLRKRLLGEPLAFFRALRDRLQSDRDTRPESLARLAQASFDLGSLTDEIGDKQDALIAYQESQAILRRLAEANPAVTEFQSQLADSHNNLGALLSATGKPVEALAAYESALAIWRRLAEANPAVTEFQSRQAGSHNNIGTVLRETGKPAEASEAYESALAIRRRLAEANPAVTKFQSHLAGSHHNLGALLSATGKPAEALAAYESALAIWRRLAEANPAVTEFQSRLAGSHHNIGNLLSDTGRPAEALEAYESALAIQRRLAEANPAVTEFQSRLADSHHNIGNLLSATGKPAEALAAYESALAIQRRLAEANPAVTEFQSRLATSHLSIGVLLSAAGKPAEALAAYESALAIWRRLAEANPAVTEFQSRLATSHLSIGVLLSAAGKPAEALEAYESALAIQRRLAEANPAVTEFQSQLAGSHHYIGNLLSAAGKPAEASEAYESALAIWRGLTRQHPESPYFASCLGGSLNNLATIDLNAERFEAARGRLRAAVEWQRKALASNPANPTYRQFLGNHLGNLILAARGLGDPEGLAEAERELTALRDSDPAIVALDARLAAVIAGDQKPTDAAERLPLAERAYDKSRHATAARLWDEAIAADPKLGDDRQAQHRYNAACAAALAGTGHGKDVPEPDLDAQAALRAQALGWLRAELAAWDQVVEDGGADAKGFVAGTLDHWKADSDLAGVRDLAELDKLPEAERSEWRGLWADVEQLRAEIASK